MKNRNFSNYHSRFEREREREKKKDDRFSEKEGVEENLD